MEAVVVEAEFAEGDESSLRRTVGRDEVGEGGDELGSADVVD